MNYKGYRVGLQTPFQIIEKLTKERVAEEKDLISQS
jgi:hypothetical protein